MIKSKVYLEIIEGPYKGRRYDFAEQDTFLIGRASDCTLCIKEDKALSRHHFLLEINQASVLIRDLGSLNGTRVNGHLIYNGRKKDNAPAPPPKVLYDGDRIQTGNTIMKLHINYPAVCIECGQHIAPEKRRACEFLNGKFLCDSCRETDVDMAVPNEYQKTARASKLKMSRRQHERAEEHPGKVLEEMLRDFLQAHGQSDEEPMIQGYRDLTVLGEGGYGVVYKARRVCDDEIVAIKTMLQTRKPEKRKLLLFEREKEILSQLDHPNIVRSKSVGVWNNIHFIEMEYVSGGSLWDLMEYGKRKVHLVTAVPLILEMLEGLAYAHEVEVVVTSESGKTKQRGIVHRDLKPSNVLLGDQDNSVTAKLSDFGLAKAFGAAGCTQGVLSRTGTTCGSPIYMAPEHLTNYKYVKAATDVFEIAATIFYMLTGQPIRPTRPGQEPFRSVVEEKPRRLQDFLSDCPQDFGDAMDRALAYDETERFQNGREFLNALKAIFL